jgi:hypothetical protein
MFNLICNKDGVRLRATWCGAALLMAVIAGSAQLPSVAAQGFACFRPAAEQAYDRPDALPPHRLALALAGPAAAQQMYRCGSTFSQQPCGADAKVIDTPGVVQPMVVPDLPVSPETIEAASAACVAGLWKSFSFRDPDSVKIGAIRRGTAGMTVFGDRRVATRAYSMRVNAKNGYGGYTGEQLYICYVDPKDERTVLNIRNLGR